MDNTLIWIDEIGDVDWSLVAALNPPVEAAPSQTDPPAQPWPHGYMFLGRDTDDSQGQS